MRLLATASALAFTAVLAACTTAASDRVPPAASAATASEVPTQLPRTVRPLHYSISVQPDAANLRFAATARIDIEVLEPVDSITLSAMELDFGSVSLTNVPGSPPLAISPVDIRPDAAQQIATFRFAQAIRPGRYQLQIDYTGKINTQATGLFALDYEGPAGTRRALYTQFAPADGRRFMPSWDEPNFRTPYDLRVTIPAGQRAVSNMPEAGRENRPDGSSIVTFRTTPAMSSYLLFLGVGDFDRIAAPSAGTEVAIVTKGGSGEQGRFALAESVKVVPWYTEYFGTPYPLPKLDNVAGPGGSQSFAAMENWGAIFTFDQYLLVDPAITTEAGKQSIALILTHEIAHQWFGNLVTMKWWDDIWLNESFASWITTKALTEIHPEWEPTLARIGTRETAMNLDSVATTHPVIQEVKTVEEMNRIFDVITYQKGEAVLTMLEDYVGEDQWRSGVRDYIRTYRLQNTVTRDLWDKVESASDVPVRAVADDFTRQPGVPLIRVESATCTGGRTNVSLRQGEFSRDRPDKTPLAWRVPVIAAVAGGRQARMLIEGGSGSLSLPGCGTAIVNQGQAGYYRTLYAPALLDGIERDFARLQPIDQIGLVADNWALGLAGYQSAAEAMDLVEAIPANGNPQLWGRAATVLTQLFRLYQGDAARQALVSRYASAKLGPVLRRIGWRAKPNEQASVAVLRANLIRTLGLLGDPTVAAEARRLRDAGDPLATQGPLRTAILAAVAANMDAAGWDQLRAQARDEKSAQVRQGLYGLLGSARDPALARRSLELALTEEPGATNRAALISAVAAEHPDLAYDFAVANRAAVEPLVDAFARAAYIPSLAAGSADAAMVTKLEAFAAAHPDSAQTARQSISAVRDRARVREQRLPDITRWLEARRGS
jgi:aminopeptidase N